MSIEFSGVVKTGRPGLFLIREGFLHHLTPTHMCLVGYKNVETLKKSRRQPVRISYEMKTNIIDWAGLSLSIPDIVKKCREEFNINIDHTTMKGGGGEEEDNTRS
jgi:hypothetical protein